MKNGSILWWVAIQLLPTMFWLMGWPKGAFCLLGVFVKEFPSLLNCFSYVQMASHPSLMMQQEITCLVVSLFVEDAPMVTHLFFADDSLLFCKASTWECQNLIVTLNLYEAVSEQKINADQSSVFFSINTPLELKVEIMEVMGPMQDSKHNKYLGLPLIIEKSKKEVFAEVKEKVEKKNVWMERKNVIYGRKRDSHKGGILWVVLSSLKGFVMKLKAW